MYATAPAGGRRLGISPEKVLDVTDGLALDTGGDVVSGSVTQQWTYGWRFTTA